MVDAKSWTDTQIIEGISIGDQKVLTWVYKKFFKVVLKHVVNNSGTEQDAKDIYQESILVLYHNVRKEGFQLNCQLQTYIFSIAKRLWLKQLRKSGQKVKLELVDDSITVVDMIEELESFEKREKEISEVSNGLNHLGEPCQTLLTDFYYKKMAMEEIAEKFGYTNSDNAKNQKYKCLQRLKKLVLKD